MQIVRRPLAPRELDAELLVLGVSVGCFGFLAGWLAVGLPWPHCLFLSLTGYPCVTCGATRAAIQLVHGNLCAALLWNPLVATALIGVALFDIYAVAVLLWRGRRWRFIFSPGEKRAIRWAVVLLLVANWTYLLLHAGKYG